MSKAVPFQIIQFSVSTLFKYQTLLFPTIQFSISTQISSIRPIARTLSSATTSGQSGPGSDGNEWELRIPQIFSITGISPSDPAAL